MPTNIGPKIGIEGEAQYRKQINDIITQTKTLSSEMKKLTSEYAKDDKSLEGNRKKREQLTRMIEKQKEALQTQTKMLEESRNVLDENGNRTDELANKTQKWQQVVNNTQTEINNLQNQLKNMPTTLTLVGDKFQEVGKQMESIGKGMTRNITAPILAGFAGSLKSAIDWESAFTGVMKTVDETATTSYDDIAKGISDIAKTTASSRNEIAGVAEVAGQLGIGADDIVEFTRTMVMLGDTTNLSAEEVATSLARIINITGDSTDTVDQLGSVIVDLGNNLATSESEIVAMATNLASSGKLAGLTTDEIFALSASMSSVGIQAQAGGTAMTQTLTAIESEVANFVAGADSNLKKISEIAGMSAEDFAKAWEEKPITAIQSFIEGLGTLDEKGESATLILDELGMSGIRQSNMLKSLALASDTLNSAIDISNNAYNENSALSIEAEKRYATMGAQLNQLKESFVELAVQIGEILMPYLQQFVDRGKELLSWMQNLNPQTKSMIVTLAGIVATVGPLLTIIGKVVVFIGTLMKSIAVIKTAIAGVSIAMSGALLPVMGIIAGITALIGVGVLLYQNWDLIKMKAQELWTSLVTAFQSIKDGVIQKFNEIVEGGRTMISNLANGILAGIGLVTSAMTQIVTGIVNTIGNFLTSMIDKGRDLIAKLGEGIMQSASDIVTRVQEIGRNIVNGVWQGIQSMIGTFTANVTQFFNGIVDSVKSTLGINSPSKVFAQIGRYMGQGLNMGWEQSMKSFNPSKDISMRVASVDMLAGIGAYGNNYSFNPNITINGDYHERDGMNIALSLDRWLGAQV